MNDIETSATHVLGSDKHILDLIDGLSGPQRETLLTDGDPNDDNVQTGIGTWMILRSKGLLNEDFSLSVLGLGVRATLRAKEAQSRPDRPLAI